MQAESRMFCRSGCQAWPCLGTGSPCVSNVSVSVHVYASVQVVSLASSSPCGLISWSKLWLLRVKGAFYSTSHISVFGKLSQIEWKTFIHTFMHLINDHLSSIHYVPGTVVGTEERKVNKTQSLCWSRLRLGVCWMRQTKRQLWCNL